METNWTIVFYASGMIEAEIVSGRLNAENIPSKLEYEAIGQLYALTMDGLGEVRVLVPNDFEQRARQALSEFYQAEDLPWERE